MPATKTPIFYFCGTALDKHAHQYGEIIATLYNNSLCDTTKHNAYIYDGPGSQSKMSFEKAMGAIKGNGWEETVASAKATILEQIEDIKRLVFVGYSRGAIECIMLANALKDAGINIDITIIALDPVPGPWNFQQDKCTVPENVTHFYGIYAQHEPIIALRPILPHFLGNTKRVFINMPGNHLTMAGIRKAPSASSPFAIAQDDLLPGVGKIIRNYIENRIIEFAGETALIRRLNLSTRDVVQLYREVGLCSRNIIKSLQPFIPMISNYGKRYVYQAEHDSWPILSNIDFFSIPQGYVNQHHQLTVEAFTQSKKYSEAVQGLKTHIETLNSQALVTAFSQTLTEEDYQDLLMAHRQFNDLELTCIINAGHESGLNTLSILQTAYQRRDIRVLNSILYKENEELRMALGDGREGDKTRAKDTSNKLSAPVLAHLLTSQIGTIQKLAFLERLFCYLALGQELKLYTRTSKKYALFLLAKRDDNITLSQTQIDHIALLQTTMTTLGGELDNEQWLCYQSESLLLQFDNTHYQTFCKKKPPPIIDDDRGQNLSRQGL